MLAGCGEGGREDFSVDVAMDTEEAPTELGRLDGGDLLRAYAGASDESADSQDMGDPMVDTEAGLAAALAPMDKAEGTNPTPGRY